MEGDLLRASGLNAGGSENQGPQFSSKNHAGKHPQCTETSIYCHGRPSGTIRFIWCLSRTYVQQQPAVEARLTHLGTSGDWFFSTFCAIIGWYQAAACFPFLVLGQRLVDSRNSR